MRAQIVLFASLIAACGQPPPEPIPNSPAAWSSPFPGGIPPLIPPAGDCNGGPMFDAFADGAVANGACMGVNTIMARRCLPVRSWRSYNQLGAIEGDLSYPEIPGQPWSPMFIIAERQNPAKANAWEIYGVALVNSAQKICGPSGCYFRATHSYAASEVPLTSWRSCSP